jgi:hypothetical protein
MDGIGGDDRACQLHAGQQFPDLGDLGGAVRHPDLPDDCLLHIPCVFLVVRPGRMVILRELTATDLSL